MTLWILAAVGAGGAAGSLLRYAVGRWMSSRNRRAFHATLLVNAFGSFGTGLLAGTQAASDNPVWYALLGTGFLGGLTTYSTLNVQKVLLWRSNRRRLFRYAAAVYGFGALALAAGLAFARLAAWSG